MNEFYNAKQEEISHTLAMLEDHVQSSPYLYEAFIKSNDEKSLRKIKSEKSQGKTYSEINRREDEYQETEASTADGTSKSHNDLNREIESIKRAIIDLHRRSKLLENFAIMNTTAFIQIIKKFDSILIEYQGRFSFIGNDDNICGGGVQASSLCEKMVRVSME